METHCSNEACPKARSAALAPISVPQRGFRVLERFGFYIGEPNGTSAVSGLIFCPPSDFRSVHAVPELIGFRMSHHGTIGYTLE